MDNFPFSIRYIHKSFNGKKQAQMAVSLVGLAIIHLLIFPYSVCGQSSSCDERQQLKIQNITASTFILSWKLDDYCTEEDTRILEPFEVTAKLKGYRACEFTINLDNLNDSFKNEYFKITLDESMYKQKYIIFGDTHLVTPNGVTHVLHPFSKYEVEVKSITTRFSKIFEVATRAGYPDNAPRMAKDQKIIATTQSIQFVWEASKEEECRLQNGILDGYRVELWGLDKWVKTTKTSAANGDHYLETKNVDVAFYYAQSLKPYSNYQLRVFNRNIKEDSPSSLDTPELYNYEKYLKINIQTLPAQPKPPAELHATSLTTGSRGNTYSSVHLRWVPNYPPTGRISKYGLRIGELNNTGALVFKEFKEFDPAKDRSLCSSSSDDMNSSFHDPYCCVLGDLKPNTTYFFGVQVFNLGVPKGSDFSETFNVTTEPQIDVLDTTSTINPFIDHTEEINTLVTPATNFSVKPPESADSDGTLIVIVLSIGILILLIICFVLRRRIRHTTEKLILRAGGGQSNINESSLNVLNSTDLSNYPFDNNISNLASPNDVTRHTSVSTSYTGRAASPSFESHVIRSVVNQIEEIQSRKLPDVPHHSNRSAINTEKNKGEVLWGLELQKSEEEDSIKTRKLPLPPVRTFNYCDPEDSIRLDTLSPSNLHDTYRHEPPDIIPQNNYFPNSKNLSHPIETSAIMDGNTPETVLKCGHDECTDTYGYLQPTFLRPNSLQDPPESPNVDKPPIPTESYTQITPEPQKNSLKWNSEETSSSKETGNVRPNSNDSDLSFSNLRTYNNCPKSQSTNVEFEDHPLISQMTMNV